MKLSSLDITFHRTVRVPDGRQSANLPPSLGWMEFHKVVDHRDRCPENWEPEGLFVALHDTEAMWMIFTPSQPVALLVGAGGINALTGEKLGTSLVKDGYVVTPPQPWLDGWKAKDGTVYQFVATRYEKGEGITVAEQLIGAESKTGAIGIALHDSKEPLVARSAPREGYSGSIHGPGFKFTHAAGGIQCQSGIGYKTTRTAGSSMRKYPTTSSASRVSSRTMGEMGVGKGGKIVQKIYPDPYGIEAWKEAATATMAFYLVNAEEFKHITGLEVPAPRSNENYKGPWFGMEDAGEKDVEGSDSFTGLTPATQKTGIKSGVFPAAEEVKSTK